MAELTFITFLSPEVSSITSEIPDASFAIGSSHSREETPTLLASMGGRTVLSQSGEAVTILKLADSEDCQMLQECLQNKPDERVDVCLHRDQEHTSDNSSDVSAKMILLFNVVSTYLLKNLLFNCIDENAKDGAERTVTTEQLYSELFHSLKNSRRIPYYFVPTQGFAGLETLSDDDRCDLMLVTTIINSLLNVV